MATGGWEGIRPDLLEQKRPQRARRTLAEITRADAAAKLERDLQRQVEGILAELEAHRAILCWYHRPDRAPGHHERAGLPDLIIGVRPGLVLAVELKRPDGKGSIRPEQETWLRAWGDRGCVATSLSDVLAHLRRWEAA